MEGIRKPRINNKLRDVMITLNKLNKEGTINSLSVIPSGINACANYDYISFKIPKNNI